MIETSDGLPLPEGIFGFAFLVEGATVFSDQCVVGGDSEPYQPAVVGDSLPTFGPVSITSEFDETLDNR